MHYQSNNTMTTDTFLPNVSVVIPIYNCETDLPELINCLFAQTYPKELVEYLLVDNNSSDRTLELLQQTAKTSPILIRVLSENKIQSSYAARNRGIRAANGQIIAFTDADCRPQAEWLKLLVAPFVNNDVAIVAGEITALPGNSLLEQFAENQQTLSQKHTLNHKFYPYGQTANLAIRRQALEKAGLFRPYLTTGGDADICWRIQQENIGRLQFATEAIVKHRHRTTLKELQSQWRRYGRSNRYLHELYGVELMPDMTLKECSYRLARWLFKELPKQSIKSLTGKTHLVDLLNTPIGILTAKARTVGQREAKLPQQAKIIETL
ncbi:MAG: glycosyltransferase [Pelatocladus maniniholoensis HA4357-MV3]|jgi:glycosyltransferase involved in cell wall biosynthesis|uniref:Glycosyltransferase n=1 Tax=Pelatocladus maniniholoensis HA4357-MV3 TaxID=1117104 RepID=A0A9E3H2Q0_9NOST|nr:glycosyltransferase [Pelatocladus maniniholoensis HA4357-MV3]BAZ68816.1 family 2 glycosyl transferase [Fischerella sp. NIES-4106]